MVIFQFREEDVKLMEQLYMFFFSWADSGKDTEEDEEALAYAALTEEEKWERAEQAREDKRKREEFKKE